MPKARVAPIVVPPVPLVVADFDVLGKQVSTNSGYRMGRFRMFKTSEAVAWQDKIRAGCPKTTLIEEDAIEIEIDFYFDSRRPDIDGSVKFLFDSLQGLLFKNDRQVFKMTISKHLDKLNPRTHIKVTQMYTVPKVKKTRAATSTPKQPSVPTPPSKKKKKKKPTKPGGY